ncbi:MAG: glycosyltransferase [Anaerolineales bacterium]|nr:glycosyltransferase [Anaerolineales bacterium]
MSRRLRVCIATTSFPRWLGDSRGTFIWEAARAVKLAGADVHVIAMHSPGARTFEVLDGILVIRPRYLVPERLEVLQNAMGGLPVVWSRNPWARFALAPFILAHTLAIIRYGRNCDVIHANWTLSAFAAYAGQWAHGRPILVTVQGSDVFQAPRVPLIRLITKLTLRGCARVLALSRSLAEVTAQLGVPVEQIEVLPNGVDVDYFRPSEKREPLILFVGSLIERKGVRYLLEAMRFIHQTLPQLRLVIIGEGPQQAELQTLANRLGLANVVMFLGSQPPDAVSNWLSRAQLCVLPSVEEGLGVVLLEALASGTPCIGARVGGIPDVVTEEVGALVPPAEPSALAQAALRILRDPELWQAMSRAARQRAESQYSWRGIAKRLLTLYEWAATHAGQRPRRLAPIDDAPR